MAEWTSKKREQLYKYLAKGEVQKATKLVEPMTALKQSDFSPKNKKALEALANHLKEHETAQTELVSSLAHKQKSVTRLGLFLFKEIHRFLSDFPASSFEKTFNKEMKVFQAIKNADSYATGGVHRDSLNNLIKAMTLFPTEEMKKILSPFVQRLRADIYNYYDFRDAYNAIKEKEKLERKLKKTAKKPVQESEKKEKPLETLLLEYISSGDIQPLVNFQATNPKLTAQQLKIESVPGFKKIVTKIKNNKSLVRQLIKLLVAESNSGPAIATSLLSKVDPLPQQTMIQGLKEIYCENKGLSDINQKEMNHFFHLYFNDLTKDSLILLSTPGSISTTLCYTAADYLANNDFIRSWQKIREIQGDGSDETTCEFINELILKMEYSYGEKNPRFQVSRPNSYCRRAYQEFEPLEEIIDSISWDMKEIVEKFPFILFKESGKDLARKINPVRDEKESLEQIDDLMAGLKKTLDGLPKLKSKPRPKQKKNESEEDWYFQEKLRKYHSRFFNHQDEVYYYIYQIARSKPDLKYLESKLWPMVRPYLVSSAQDDYGITSQSVVLYLLLSNQQDSELEQAIQHFVEKQDNTDREDFFTGIRTRLFSWLLFKPWWKGHLERICDYVFSATTKDGFSFPLREVARLLTLLCRYDKKWVYEYIDQHKGFKIIKKKQPNIYLDIQAVEKKLRYYWAEFEVLKLLLVYLDQKKYLRHALQDPYLTQSHCFALAVIAEDNDPEGLNEYFTNWWRSPHNQLIAHKTIMLYYIDNPIYRDNISARVVECLRDTDYELIDWGARIACTHPEYIRSIGEDPLDLLSLGLWRTKSAEIRDTTFRIHYFAEQNHCTPQEAIDTISQVFDSDQSAAWNHATRSIKDLLKMDKDAVVTCADRLNEIIEIDSKFQKTFAPLLKRKGA